MICRLLHRFSDEHLIHITRTEFVLTDQEGLARLATRVETLRGTRTRPCRAVSEGLPRLELLRRT
ncbi:MAG: hypothetical protein AB1449_09085 [Chloroflexota bacterium]